MAFELLESNFTIGLESHAARVIGTLKYLITLATPITESVMRLAIEASQPIVADGRATALTDAGWLSFVSDLSAIRFNESALTVGERTLINTLHSIVAPDPQLDCCGVAVPIEVLTSVQAFEQVGFANFRHEFQLRMDGTTDCNVKSVVVSLTPIAAAPAITSANPLTVTFKQCEQGFRLYSFIVVEFGADPSGESYDITDLDFKDADGASITNFNPTTYNWDIP